MQCKENMEIWQRMAADEEAALNAGASQSKGSSGHAVLSSSSNAGAKESERMQKNGDLNKT